MKRLLSIGGLLVCLSLVFSTGCGMFGKKPCLSGDCNGGGCTDGTCDVTQAVSDQDIALTAYTETQKVPTAPTTSAPGPVRKILQASCST